MSRAPFDYILNSESPTIGGLKTVETVLTLPAGQNEVHRDLDIPAGRRVMVRHISQFVGITGWRYNLAAINNSSSPYWIVEARGYITGGRYRISLEAVRGANLTTAPRDITVRVRSWFFLSPLDEK